MKITDVRTLCLSRKHEPELLPAIEATRRIRNPALRARALSGIGWGVQHRYEIRGSLEDLAMRLDRVPQRERARVVSGMHWFAEARISALQAQPAGIGGGAGRRRQLERLRAFEAFARAEKQALDSGSRSDR